MTYSMTHQTKESLRNNCLFPCLAIAIGWSPSQVGWTPLLYYYSNKRLLGWRPLILGWRPKNKRAVAPPFHGTGPRWPGHRLQRLLHLGAADPLDLRGGKCHEVRSLVVESYLGFLITCHPGTVRSPYAILVQSSCFFFVFSFR